MATVALRRGAKNTQSHRCHGGRKTAPRRRHRLDRGNLHPLGTLESASKRSAEARHDVARQLLPRRLRRRKNHPLDVGARWPELSRISEIRPPRLRIAGVICPECICRDPFSFRPLPPTCKTRMGLSLQTGLGTRDNSSMSLGYAPERRKVLALQVETPAANGLIIPSTRDLAHEKGRQSALSVPESVRALGEPLEPLFEACGGRQTLSLSVRRRDGAAPPETYEFQQPFILIGRCQQSDLPLNDAKVNFRHIYLQLVDGRWLFVDLGLLSGSAAGERGRSASGWFDPASELVVGPYVITHVALETTMLARRDNQSSKLPADLPAVYLEFINGLGSSRNRQSRRVLGPVTLLGSSRQCDLWLRDESVSKVHASLVL